jgi:nucleoside-diphosphate-sugar epimerase
VRASTTGYEWQSSTSATWLARPARGHELVFHLAANSDIERGRHESDRDFRLGTIATFNVLEATPRANINQLVFSSSSVVYGEIATKRSLRPTIRTKLDEGFASGHACLARAARRQR